MELYPNLSAVLEDPQFLNLASFFRKPFRGYGWDKGKKGLWRKLFVRVPFWNLWDAFDDVTEDPNSILTNPDQVLERFTVLCSRLMEADPVGLGQYYTTDEVEWFTKVLYSPDAPTIISMLKAYASAPETSEEE